MTEQKTIETLPPTPAGLEQALAILAASTGCPSAEADRLLREWDALNATFLTTDYSEEQEA